MFRGSFKGVDKKIFMKDKSEDDDGKKRMKKDVYIYRGKWNKNAGGEVKKIIF